MSSSRLRIAALVGTVIVAWTLLRHPLQPPPASTAAPVATPAIPATPAATAPSATSAPTASSAAESERVTYAIDVAKLAGLAPDAETGTRFDVWVTWGPPATKTPKVQLLLEGVVLQRVVPPVTADGPPAAVLELPRRQIPDLIYGDRFGLLSVTSSATS